MHGCEVRKKIRRMLSCPSSLNTRGVISAVDVSRASLSKDVRKINIGDCALFKPPQESPPFIGIIRSLGPEKEENLQLGVTWLYRPADIQLLKGVAVEAAPNEVFYSFHRDEIPAASLLHPCKVAFLPKGVELPSGVSSFVCRRVYDTTNKRLWWLTDKDYINGRQEEVDQLLKKTQFEMHATVQQQQGGRSPKPVNSPMSTSQLKQSPDSVQNSTTLIPTQTKGKKRERTDQASEPVKRERSSKADDGDSNVQRSEVWLKSEIAKITEKGGLVDSDSVERLVQLMQPDKLDRKRDITCRSLLAAVIAATDKDECLDRFVQLRGLPILDGWLQEVHKGKVGDSSSPRDHDKSVEEFLLTLLRALDRLPVNLNALQMCNIGKSVNHLRSHRNSDIQRKARSLVDTWKKRVEAEMNINDSRSTSHGVSWTRSRNDVSHGVTRHASASDAAIKNPHSQLSSSKSAPVKSIQGEVAAKSVSASPATAKLPSSPASTGANMKDGHHKISVICGSSELPISAVKDEKSSSSSQSHSNSYCSSDHVKVMGPSSVKEEARCSNSGSTSLNRSSGSGSRHRRTANTLHGVSASADQQEVKSSKTSSLTRISVSEKFPQPATSEKPCDVPVADSNNKLIVKISNRGRSPAQNVNGVPLEDPLLMNSRAPSPAAPEKHGQSEHSPTEKIDGHRNNEKPDIKTESWHNNMKTESWHSNNIKVEVTARDEGDRSPVVAPESGRSQTGDEADKLTDLAKVVSASRTELKSRKLHDSSLSSINALIESCAQYSETTVPMTAGDVVGMNLLASVAAGEIPKASPGDSPQRSTSVADESYRENHVKPKPNGAVEDALGEPNQSMAAADVEDQKQNISSGASVVNDEGQGSDVADQGESVPAIKDERDPSTRRSQDVSSGLATQEKAGDGSLKEVNQVNPTKGLKGSSVPSAEVDEKNVVKERQEMKAVIEKLPSASKVAESLGRIENGAVSCINNLLPGQFSDLREDDADAGCDTHLNQGTNQKVKLGKDNLPPLKKQEESATKSGSFDGSTKGREADLGNGDIPAVSASQTNSLSPAHDNDLLSDAKDPKQLVCEGEDVQGERRGGGNVSLLAVGSSGTDGKLGFDLNESFDVDDSKDVDLPSSVNPGCLSSGRLSSHLPSFSVASASVGLPASITVAAAAKGAFVPPEDLLRSKGELGWKGSAATSAFRPAEPRKVSETPFGNSSNAHNPDSINGKQSRRGFEIDLNVADERSMEDMDCQINDFQSFKRDGLENNYVPTTGGTCGRNAGGLDLDLNRVDEAPDASQPLPVSHRFDMPLQPIRLSSSAVSNSDSGRRDFDLNDGPAADEATVDSSSFHQNIRSNIPSQPSVGFRINSSEMGNLNPWYPVGSSFSAIPIPAPLPHRDQPFSIASTGGGPPRMLGGPGGAVPFNPDMYRGSVLSSSPAVPYPGASYQYPVFPFGTSFPLPSSSIPGGSTAFMDLSSAGRLCIPAVTSHFVGSAPNVPSQYPQPYLVSLSDVGNSVVVDNSRKWGRQGLDLNAGPGPGAPDPEARDDAMPIPPRPVSSMGSLVGLTEEQSRMYAMAGGILKRKEPEGGWDSDRLSSYKQPSWQ
ncbi:hypothetical protein vseg_017087 [Gypsophila vaccaria]